VAQSRECRPLIQWLVIAVALLVPDLSTNTKAEDSARHLLRAI